MKPDSVFRSKRLAAQLVFSQQCWSYSRFHVHAKQPAVTPHMWQHESALKATPASRMSFPWHCKLAAHVVAH
jgi:hypothetical protein